jgi:hypothetical protein
LWFRSILSALKPRLKQTRKTTTMRLTVRIKPKGLILGRAAPKKSEYSEKSWNIPLTSSIIQEFRKILLIFPRNPNISQKSSTIHKNHKLLNPKYSPKILINPQTSSNSSKIPKNPKYLQKSTILNFWILNIPQKS